MTKEEGKKEVYSVAPWRAVHQEITAPSYSVRTESVTPVLMRNLTDLPPHTWGGGTLGSWGLSGMGLSVLPQMVS